MTAPGNGYLIVILTLSILITSAYAVGRIHEWHRHGLKRDEAYRSGYDKASHKLIGLIETKGVPPVGDRLNSRRMGRAARGHTNPGPAYQPRQRHRQRQQQPR